MKLKDIKLTKEDKENLEKWIKSFDKYDEIYESLALENDVELPKRSQQDCLQNR